MKHNEASVQQWAINGHHDAVWRVVEPLLGKLACRRVIDVGCGPGSFIARFAGKGFFCAACDAQSDLGQRDRCDRFFEVDLNRWDFETNVVVAGRYGLAMAVEIIEHLENPWQFLRQLNRMLESGGYCVVTSPNNQDEASRVDYLAYGELPWFKLDGLHITGHISPMSLQHFYLMIQDACFELVSYHAYGRVPTPAMNWKGRIVRHVMRQRIMRPPGLEHTIHVWLLRKVNEAPLTGGVDKTTSVRLAEASRLSQIVPEPL